MYALLIAIDDDAVCHGRYMHHLCTAEMGVTYLMKGRLRVVVSTFQLGVLMHFDKARAMCMCVGVSTHFSVCARA
jgi:hypothetical protein